MEHIIQFGITIDDNAIQREIIQLASEQLMNEIRDQMNGYNQQMNTERIIRSEINTQFDKYKDEIIEKTCKKLADKLVKCKIVREATQGVVDKVLNGEEV